MPIPAVVGPPTTVMPNLSATQWAQRLLNVFPADWSSDNAKAAGGVLFSLFNAIGTNLVTNDSQVIYAYNATRIATATDTALDQVAKDYFAGQVARVQGEPDSTFRQRIYSNLLLPAVTRAAFAQLLNTLVGVPPRLMESWNLNDSAMWDGFSYWDVDSVANPFRWGDPALRYQAFIESSLPAFSTAGLYPVYTLDDGFSWDTPVSCWLDPQPSWFIGPALLDQLINRIRAEGTIVWRKYYSQAFQQGIIGGASVLAPNTTSITYPIYPPFAGLFTVVARASWNTDIVISSTGNSTFTLTFSVPVPPTGTWDFDWLAAPITLPGAGAASIPPGVTSFTIQVPQGLGNYALVAIPNWSTNIWTTAISSTSQTIQFSQFAPYNALVNYIFLPTAGQAPVIQGSTSVNIPVKATTNYQGFVLPNWNTTVSLARYPNQLIATFNTPAPAGASLQWAYHQS